MKQQLYQSFIARCFLPPALPQFEVEIKTPLQLMDSSTTTLECSVTGVPYITTLQLFGPEVVLVNSTNLTLTHTLDPVLAKDAGPYFCKAILEFGLDMPLESQSVIHYLTVQGNNIPTLKYVRALYYLLYTLSVPHPTLTVTASPSGTVNAGSSVVIICECIWNARISVSLSWDTPIQSPSSITDITQTAAGNILTRTANITISHVQKRDEGEYSCTVKPDNDLMPYVIGPTVTRSVSLRVLGEGINTLYILCMHAGYFTKSSTP